MQTAPFLSGKRELRNGFYQLLDALSALRGLSELDPRHQPEERLLECALGTLIDNGDFDLIVAYLWRDGALRPVARLGIDHVTRSTDADAPVPAGLDALAALVARNTRVEVWSDATAATAAAGLPTLDGSACSAPLLHRGEALGALCVHHPEAGGLPQWQGYALSLYCHVLGALVENNRLVGEMEQAVKRRTTQLEVALREAERLKMRYEQLSNVDELTGLHNRRFFFPEAEAAVARTVRYNHPFSLLITDIDRFKAINDSHGHAAGDRVLREVAAQLRRDSREGDIVARIGGEEFVIALPNTDLDGAHKLAERIRQRIADSRMGISERITVSFGVTTLDRGHAAHQRSLLDRLVREADEALYLAKTRGRNRVCCYVAPVPDLEAPNSAPGNSK